MRSDQPEQASQSVEGLKHGGDERGIATISRENLSHRNFQPADEVFRFLQFLIGHVHLLRSVARRVDVAYLPARERGGDWSNLRPRRERPGCKVRTYIKCVIIPPA